MADFVPVPLPDENEAGSVWRDHKLRDFMFRLRSLGLEDDPQFAALAAQIAEQTAALEALAEAQRGLGYQRPWWQDGEYDAARADSANDRGMEAFGAGRHSTAFDCFTEAIRLHPTSAVYHCNRAAAALKLGRPELAAEDAAAAAERDPGYLRAHLRAGRAHLQLGQPAEAEASFRCALQLDAACASATRGLAEAAALVQRQLQQADAEQAAAQAGTRPALTREAVPAEEAAVQLLAADAMLAANPGLHAARCARVEALLLCSRYTDAAAGCSSMLEGTAERLYLEAEVAWRQGRLQDAAEALHLGLQAAGGSCAKCASLLQNVEGLQGLEEQATAALEEGRSQACIDACSQMLGQLHPTACTGLACAVLHRRAEAHAARQAWQAAVTDMDAALALDAGQVACLQLRAEAHKQTGAYTLCFLDLQRLRKVAPGTPGLAAQLEEVARLSLGGSRGGGGGTSAAARAGGGSAAEAALQLLGLPAGATAAQARRAYLAAAVKWHPDKWAGGSSSEEERRRAEERFKQVQAAYELLAA